MGNKKAEILDFGILDTLGNCTTLLTSGAKYTLFMRAVFYEQVEDAVAGFLIRNLKGVDMYGTSTLVQKMPIGSQRPGDVIEVRLHITMWLTNGTYFLTFALADPDAETDVQYDIHYDALQFDVGMKDGIFTISIVDLDGRCEVRTLSVGTAAPQPEAVHTAGGVE